MATLAPPPRPEWQQRLGTLAPTFPPEWARRFRIAAIAIAALLALLAVVGFLAVPPIAKWKIETLASAELGRKATVGDVAFNPFTLRARIANFTLADRDPGRTLLAFEALDLDFSVASLRRLAPVLDAVRVQRPRIEIARAADGRLNIQDLIDRAAAPSTGEKLTFAVNNIEVDDGTIVLADALKGHRTEVTHLAVGIPFLSSFASDARIRVSPYLRGAVDGAPFALDGRSTSPFQDTQQATLDINLDALPLARYGEYAPLPNGLKIADGALTTRLSLVFLTWKGAARGITLTGSARTDRLTLTRKDDSPLAAVRTLEVRLGTLDLLGRSAGIDRITVSAPEMELRRLANGTLELQQLLSVAPGTHATGGADAPASAARPWSWSVNEAHIVEGTVRILDAAVAPAFGTRLSNVTLAATRLASRGPAGSVEVGFDSEDGARFDARSEVDIAGSAARGHFAVSKLPIAKLHPYLANVLAADVRRGLLDFGADFDAAAAPARMTLAQGTMSIADLDVAVRGDREALWRMGRLDANGVALDVFGHDLAIDKVEAQQAALRLLRDADGTMHFERILPRSPQGSATPQEPGGTGWNVLVRTLLLERLGVDFEDRTMDPTVRLRITGARVAAENLDSRPGAKASIDLAAHVGAKGQVRAKGTASARPPTADVRIDATALDLVPLRTYLEARTNVVVTSGTVNANGRVTYRDMEASGGQARYVGDVVVNDFGSLDRPGSQDLVRWKRLALAGADVTSAPFNLVLGAVDLDQFYARLILSADAKLNVLQLLRQEVPADAAATPEQAPAAAAATTTAPPEHSEIPASIGRIQLTNGEVEFSDFFVKPNYSVHLTQVAGSVSSLVAAQPGAVDIAARVDGAAPVEIRGTVNPFARELALDITGKATDVDLPPLTPYSVKYAGYGIEKGKLSMEVHYRLDNRKLSASNKLVLDQLTFGERVESPTATKLPVLFVVSLLKDRNGVINLELPIQGTLDDPKFSIWGIVVQIIGNLLTKAATAPFALLGALVGGGGEQLAYVEFAPGSAALSPAGETKLATLSKALVERPALKLDIAGRAIPDADTEGLKRAALDRALRARKQKDLAKGESAAPLAEITLDDADRAKYLKEVYGDTRLPDKPRNFIGMAKDVPAAQMESMLLASYKVDEAALRELADHRAQAAKEWFVAKGNVPHERVFIVASRLGADGLKGEGAPTRADFAIR